MADTIKWDIPERFDADVADDGIWYEIYDENDEHWGDFKCALMDHDSRRIKLVQERIKTKYARELRTNKMNNEKLGMEVFLDCILLDWRDVKAGGKTMPFTPEDARSYFEQPRTKYVFGRLLIECQDVTNYQRVDKDEASGN